MSDLTETAAHAAVSAIADMMPLIEQDVNSVRFLTVEVEFRRGTPTAARAWIERGCNLGRLRGDRGLR